MSARGPAPRPDDDGFFLPDFCQAPAVLAIVLIAALLGFVLALARLSAAAEFWIELARTTAFLLWAGLLCAGAWCRLRPWFARKPARTAIAWALGTMVGVVAVLSLAVCLFGRWWLTRFGAPSAIFPHQWAGFVLPNVLIASIVGALALRYFYVSQQWRRSVELEARARIHALQARIRPHFLFNSMNTIASLTRSDPRLAEQAIADLSDLFRASLREHRERIPLANEIEIARAYERVERLRLGARLTVDWQVDDVPMEAPVPALILQPLLENAVYHGIEPLEAGGTIRVAGRRDGRQVVLTIDNPVAPRVVARRTGHRIGLDNVRQRLELMFHGEAEVEVIEAPERFVVTLRFPAGETTA
jgi:two-component system sensor histidine kinase AlgZ